MKEKKRGNNTSEMIKKNKLTKHWSSELKTDYNYRCKKIGYNPWEAIARLDVKVLNW